MSIRNQNSTVPAERSINNIEKKLIENGATDIMKQYEDGKITSLCFRKAHNNQHLAFKLPANVNAIYATLCKEYKRIKPGQAAMCMAQAERTAWKLIYEWVDLQMTMIRLEQVEFAEVFLPYMLVGKNQTVYTHLNQNNFKALTSGQS